MLHRRRGGPDVIFAELQPGASDVKGKKGTRPTDDSGTLGNVTVGHVVVCWNGFANGYTGTVVDVGEVYCKSVVAKMSG